MKVLVLESSMNWGGQEERCVREILWLKKNGHAVILVCNQGSAIAERAALVGIDIRRIGMRASFSPASIAKLGLAMAAERPDLIHAHSAKDAWLAFWFHCAGFPVVRSRHITIPGKLSFSKKFLFRHGCRRHIASAAFIAADMHSKIGIPRQKIEVVGEFVDTDEFKPGNESSFRSEFGIPTEAPLFAVIAMLRGEKGQDLFLQAARIVLEKHPQARFAIVGGDVAGRSKLQELRHNVARDFGSAQDCPVVLTGFRTDIAAIMRAIDCLVVPSRHEAQTLVIPQAFATAKPVIGSNVGGIPELVADGSTGFLFPSGDFRSLAHAMSRLIENPELARSMGQSGFELSRRELSKEVKMRELLACYQKTISPP